MKEKRNLLGCIIGIVIALGVFVVKPQVKSLDAASPNVEALAQGDASITCDSGDYGLCHVFAYDVQLGGLIIYYYCQWTGRQEDYCPFSVYLLNKHD